jgi:L-seryl-tRNA(Ser) seleniumtransferase
LALAACANGREAVVSRGELVEIGGGFRIPDVVAQSGARLVEVGTTNRTHLADYENAIRGETAALLKVHRSNFEISGFVAEVAMSELVALGRARGVVTIDDAGSGCMDAIADVVKEASVRTRVAMGADVVCFSGDKLLGGPQAGIAVGGREVIEKMRRTPLYRALRPDKITLAALGATLALWRDHPERLPIVRMLRATPESLEARCLAVRARIADTRVEIADAVGRIGGGAAPSVTLPSRALRIGGVSADALAARLRHGEPMVIARIEDDAVWIDLRCVAPDDDEALAAALGAALS